MQKKVSKRKPGPDLLKILATIYVIIIHHKFFAGNPVFMSKFKLLSTITFVFTVVLGICLFFVAKKKGKSNFVCVMSFIVPLMCLASFAYLRRYAVAIFLLVTGYLLASSIKKLETPVKSWYTSSNIIPRIMRFYLPFIPVFIVGLVYKIIVKDYSYTAMEVIARFILGGFKPGSYYITILAEVVLVFPIIYILVRKLKSLGVLIAVLLTFAYDTACTYFGMNDIMYKFLVFRFTTHIALGVYASITDFKTDHLFNTVVFAVGMAYFIVCLTLRMYVPTIFFQWSEASFPVALFMYVPVMWFIEATKGISYTDSKLSGFTMLFANATYHIFLIQLLYYTTFGFEFNEYVFNVALTMPLNILITVPLGIGYYMLLSPMEKRITDSVTLKLQKNKKNQ